MVTEKRKGEREKRGRERSLEGGGVFHCQGRWCRLARGEIFFGAERRFLEEL